MKYRHSDGKLVLKVTDDKECLKFKTDQAQDAKKMEKLNNIFFTLMARGSDAKLLGLSKNVAAPVLDPSKIHYFEGFDPHPLTFLMSPSNLAKSPQCSCNRNALPLLFAAADISEVGGKEQMEAQAPKKGRGRKQ
ncbi:Signal recognition particle 9 kDa protein [Capsicum chinense]|nr:Signal recognition particle 9 kDa protein [Capsicum chinense]